MKEEYIKFIASNLASINLQLLDLIAQLIEKSIQEQA